MCSSDLGYGMNVSGCNTLVNLNGSGNCVGTIAGEIDPDGSASDNYFVHETEAGIDGISYAGKAEGMSYEAFMARDGIPAEFSSFAVTFTANGEVVKTITFAYGGSIDESQIPDCPTVEGNYGTWPEYDYSHLTFDLEVKAEYTAVSTVVAGDLYADNSLPLTYMIHFKVSGKYKCSYNQHSHNDPCDHNCL